MSSPFGSRAYRKRDRREMEREKAEKKALKALSKTHSDGVVASGVVVGTQLERKEEGRSETQL